ncbi:hypothetical protein BDZ89DRAFT_1068426 [Hymenopellis radicata]|nr:hypothetical protein BDZ89DRAFT_1068426 [Hymenopellis radicata]
MNCGRTDATFELKPLSIVVMKSAWIDFGVLKKFNARTDPEMIWNLWVRHVTEIVSDSVN